MAPHELTFGGVTHAGEAVGRLPDGKAVFVPYVIPGERALVELVESHPRWARGRLVEVVEASPDRVAAPCPYFGPGRCGGCVWQHIRPQRQALLRAQILRDQLQRIGGLDDPVVAETVQVEPYGYRNVARMGVDERGRLGFRRAGSNDIVAVDACLLLDSGAQGLRDAAGDRWSGADEVELRSGETGGALVVHPTADTTPGLGPLPAGDVPVALTSPPPQHAVALRGDPTVVQQVGGFAFRVSATSFFQANTQGAAVLLELVRTAADVGPADLAVDLYGGVGLFARGLAADGALVAAVERNPSACADARHNLAGTDAVVVQRDARRAINDLASGGGPLVDAVPELSAGADVVVVDPPRRGVGGRSCEQLARARPRRIVYVSCDPAALARDTRVLVASGYRLATAVPVDQFAQTAHLEAVATFVRTGTS